MRNRLAAAATLILLVACNSTSRTPSASATSSSPTVSQTPSATPSATPAAKIAYLKDTDLWVRDLGTEQDTRLTTDGKSGLEAFVHFVDATHVSYGTQAVNAKTYGVDRTVVYLHEIGGKPTQLFQTTAIIVATGWSPDGKTLAYLTYQDDHTIWLYDTTTKKSTKLRTLGVPLGRGGTESDDAWLDWSADGTKLLVTDTALDPDVAKRNKTTFVLNRAGKDVMPPFTGTFARWVGGEGSFVWRSFEVPTTWHRFNAETGKSTQIEMTKGTARARVSPTAASVTDEEPGAHPVLRAYDVAATTEKFVRRDMVYALWISPTSVVATVTKPCAADCGEGPAWTSTGDAVIIEVATGTSTPLAGISTINGDSFPAVT